MELNCDFQYVLGKDRRTFYMGLAMLWVIGYHVYLHDQGFYDTSLKVFRNLFKYGYVGVDLFLFFSAYGLCHSWMRSSIKDFYVKRFVRIVPIFLLYGLVRTFLQSDSLLTFFHHSLLEVTSLSLIQTPLTCPGKLSLDWFVPAILNLYILFPLFYRLIRKLYRRLPPRFTSCS